MLVSIYNITSNPLGLKYAMSHKGLTEILNTCLETYNKTQIIDLTIHIIKRLVEEIHGPKHLRHIFMNVLSNHIKIETDTYINSFSVSVSHWENRRNRQNPGGPRSQWTGRLYCHEHRESVREVRGISPAGRSGPQILREIPDIPLQSLPFQVEHSDRSGSEKNTTALESDETDEEDRHFHQS